MLGKLLPGIRDRVFRNLTCKRIQVDEIWAFVQLQAKERCQRKGSTPASWRRVDLDCNRRRYQADPLVVRWWTGQRRRDHVYGWLANRVQLTSFDGHKAYLEAVEGAFGADIDHAMLVKFFEEGRKPRTFCRIVRDVL
jgi:hypothetical protein